MSFDIYAGAFSRFYAREWENAVQKHARETGMTYHMIRPSDSGPENWDEVKQVVHRWRLGIKNGLGDNAPPDLDWSEERDSPYFTDRPGWDGYSALVVLAASTETGRPLPARLSEDALASDVVTSAVGIESRAQYRSIFGASLWLPGSFDFSFDFVDLSNKKIHIGSVRRLEHDLRNLQNARRISDADLAESIKGGVEDTGDTFAMGCFGLAVFLRIAGAAREHRLPMMLAY